MKKITLSVLLIALLASSCISTKQRARSLVRRGFDKIQKGIRLDPSVADSVNKMLTVEIIVPGETREVLITPQIDSAAFNKDAGDYDSLVLRNDSLRRAIASGNLLASARERALAESYKVNQQIKLARDKFMRGYAIDSVYVFNDDRINIETTIKGGQLASVFYKIKEQTVKKDVQTQHVTLDGSRQQFWKTSLFWILIAIILFLVIIIIIRR